MSFEFVESSHSVYSLSTIALDGHSSVWMILQSLPRGKLAPPVPSTNIRSTGRQRSLDHRFCLILTCLIWSPKLEWMLDLDHFQSWINHESSIDVWCRKMKPNGKQSNGISLYINNLRYRDSSRSMEPLMSSRYFDARVSWVSRQARRPPFAGFILRSGGEGRLWSGQDARIRMIRLIKHLLLTNV